MPDKISLVITGADEDIPRLLLGYGRACGGEVTLVYRPRSGEALLVHQPKKGMALVWNTPAGAGPMKPTIEWEPANAKAAIVRTKAGPPPRGPAMLRGTWRGWYHCAEARIELVRKIASYGVLRVESGTDGWWSVHFERAERWFTSAKVKSIRRADLGEALKAGYAEAQGIVGEACSVRDTHRRSALDPAHAAKYPPKPAREKKDPTDRYKPKPAAEKTGAKAKATTPAAPAAKVSAPSPSCGGTCDHGPKKPTPPAPKASPKPSSTRPARKTPEPAVDPNKDQILLNLFSQGIKQAAQELGL